MGSKLPNVLIDKSECVYIHTIKTIIKNDQLMACSSIICFPRKNENSGRYWNSFLKNLRYLLLSSPEVEGRGEKLSYVEWETVVLATLIGKNDYCAKSFLINQ